MLRLMYVSLLCYVQMYGVALARQRGLSRVRAIKHRNGDRRPAGHQRADTKGKTGWKFFLELSKQKAESCLRVNFGCGLLSAARPCDSASLEHPKCRTTTCFGARHCGFLWQCPWSGMGGHRDHPTGIRRTGSARVRYRGSLAVGPVQSAVNTSTSFSAPMTRMLASNVTRRSPRRRASVSRWASVTCR